MIEDYISIHVFLETDSIAKDARNIIEHSSNNNKRIKEAILDLKEILNNNIINVQKPVDIKIAESLPYITGNEIRYFPIDDLDVWYDPETGFNPGIDAVIERQMI